MRNNTLNVDARKLLFVGLVAGVSLQNQQILVDDEQAKTVTTNTYNVEKSKSFVPTYGRFHDDPTWDDFMSGIEEYRAQMNDLESALD